MKIRILVLLGLCGLCFGVQTTEEIKMDDMAEKIEAAPGTTMIPPREKEDIKLGQRFGEDGDGYSYDSRYDAQTAQDVAGSVFDLAHGIGGTLLSSRTNKFEVFSPTSIAAALNLVLLGSKGSTFNELMSTLGYSRFANLQYSPYKIHEEFGLMLEDLIYGANPARPRSQYQWKDRFYSRYPYDPVQEPDARNLDSSSHRVAVANGLFIQQGYSIRPDFVRVAQETYRCEIQSLDFLTNPQGSAKYINDWVSEKTFGLVPKLVGDSIDPDTRAIIANAVYFKAEWERHFIEGATGIKDFYPQGKEQPPIQIEMMANGGRFPYYESRELGCEILGFPYKQNQSTMYVIMPQNSDRRKLIELQAKLTSNVLEDMISRMSVKTSVILLPKLHLDSQTHLRDPLERLGIQSLFDPYKSDLSLISGADVTYSEDFASGTLPERPLTSGVVGQPPLTGGSVASPPLTTGTVRHPPLTSGSVGSQPLTTGTVREQPLTSGSEIQQPLSSGTGNQRPLTHGVMNENGLQQRSFDDRNDYLIFSRLSEDAEEEHSVQKRQVKYKTESKKSTLTLKDFIINKRITKEFPEEKKKRVSRNAQDPSYALKYLDHVRNTATLKNPQLFADDVLHRVNLIVNEKGTEAGAATAVTLNRSGPQVLFRVDGPFILLVRHDPTRLPLFYATVFEPVNS